MTKRQRLDTVFSGKKPDRLPVLGGWIAAPALLLKITGKSADDYNNDPQGTAIEAYKELNMDGLVDIFTTNNVNSYRCVDSNPEGYVKSNKGISFEDVEISVENLPEPAEYEKSFDFENEYAAFKLQLTTMQEKCGDIVYMPGQWGAGANASWYHEYGYENYLLLAGLRPDLCIKLFKIGGATGRNRSKLIAAAVKEGIFPKAVLLGEDICTQRGSMISPDFLNKHYAPALAYGLEPLLEAGCRPVWHSDGDVRELIPMLLDCGVGGFQGFQSECGMVLSEIVKLRTRNGDKLLIFGPISVTTELPVLMPHEIRRRVRQAVHACRNEADLVLFTSNTINPDVPYHNLMAMYDEAEYVNY